MIKLITSGDYICSELAAELGKLPPSFLPVGNKRLYEYQVEFLRQIGPGDTYISLPKDYIIPQKDLDYFSREKIGIISTDSDISISESISHCLKAIGRYSESLVILHGDTLIQSELPNLDLRDLIIVSESTDNYNWGFLNKNHDKIVYVGLFSISSQRDFLHSLSKNNLDFISAIKNYYNEKYPILWKVKQEEWSDFGHTNTYFRSRSRISTTRHFNNFQSDGEIVRKTSKNIKKILAEANWFKEIPERISLYSPKLLRVLENGYELEYLYLLPLSEIFVFGNLPINAWEQILLSCKEFLNKCSKVKRVDHSEIDKKIYKEKTLERIISFSLQRNISLSQKIIFNDMEFPSIMEIANECIEFLLKFNYTTQTIIHGDFCFSNILYNFRSQSIKIIDPRGLDAENNFSLYGDCSYDLAKLGHSILGGYDFIISNYQTCREIDFSLSNIKINDFYLYSTPDIEKIREIFTKMYLKNPLKKKKIYSIMVLLFLSMLPLHSDYPLKQNAMLATSINLYKEIK